MMLDTLSRTTRRYIALSEAEADVIALWIVHTHCFEAAQSTPYLAITSAEKQCGKSRLLELLEMLAANPWLGLGPNTTSMRTEKARNFKADSPTRQAGLEVLRVARASAVTDQAFFSAMILGATVQVWRFALSAVAPPATETSDRPIPSRLKPIDPNVEVAACLASPGTDQDALRESLQRGGPG